MESLNIKQEQPACDWTPAEPETRRRVLNVIKLFNAGNNSNVTGQIRKIQPFVIRASLSGMAGAGLVPKFLNGNGTLRKCLPMSCAMQAASRRHWGSSDLAAGSVSFCPHPKH
eukprot:230845-Hanusia_phi.AAC.1